MRVKPNRMDVEERYRASRSITGDVPQGAEGRYGSDQ